MEESDGCLHFLNLKQNSNEPKEIAQGDSVDGESG